MGGAGTRGGARSCVSDVRRTPVSATLRLGSSRGVVRAVSAGAARRPSSNASVKRDPSAESLTRRPQGSTRIVLRGARQLRARGVCVWSARGVRGGATPSCASASGRPAEKNMWSRCVTRSRTENTYDSRDAHIARYERSAMRCSHPPPRRRRRAQPSLPPHPPRPFSPPSWPPSPPFWPRRPPSSPPWSASSRRAA